MILKMKGKDFHNKIQQDIYTDSNVAEIKSLSYVCKDRHTKLSKHYIKRKEMESYPCTKFQNMIWHVIKQSRKHTEDRHA